MGGLKRKFDRCMQAVEDALNAGHERFSFDDRDNVKKVIQDVRLDTEIAKEILSNTARKAFMGFISRSRNKANKLEAAKELKALVYFSNLVVTPLLEDINVSLFISVYHTTATIKLCEMHSAILSQLPLNDQLADGYLKPRLHLASMPPHFFSLSLVSALSCSEDISPSCYSQPFGAWYKQ